MKESDDSKNIFLENPVCRMQLITYERQWTEHLASGDLGSLDKKCVICGDSLSLLQVPIWGTIFDVNQGEGEA